MPRGPTVAPSSAQCMTPACGCLLYGRVSCGKGSDSSLYFEPHSVHRVRRFHGMSSTITDYRLPPITTSTLNLVNMLYPLPPPLILYGGPTRAALPTYPPYLLTQPLKRHGRAPLLSDT